MNRPREDLLARPGLAPQKHGDVGFRHASEPLEVARSPRQDGAEGLVHPREIRRGDVSTGVRRAHPAVRTRLLVGCLLAGLVGLMPMRARADEPHSDSETSIQRGVELRREGRNGEALVEFQKAFALEPSPRARAQIALALQSLGDWLGAEQWLTKALQTVDDAWIDRYRTELGSALAIQAHLGSLVLLVDAKEGEVLVNGAAQALPSASPIRVLAGSVDVVVRVPGHADAHSFVDLPAGGEVRASVAVGPELATGPVWLLLRPVARAPASAAAWCSPGLLGATCARVF
jgi:hypothetical protein